MFIPTPAPSPYITIAQAAREIDVHRKTIYEWIKRGTLVARILPGGEYRLERNVWADFLRSLPTSQPRAANDDQGAENVAPAAPRLDESPVKRRPKSGRNFFAIGADEA